MPAVAAITARPDGDAVRLTWPSAGLGLRYRLYLARPSQGYVHVRSVSRPGVTVTGLARGVTYQVEVVPVNVYSDAGPAAFATVRIS